ncbi:MAG: hypothetical protein CMM01_08710 [Rhodopirellula sp.]|nr:hypothetical protein [Rhodopirellula sp.]
MLLFQDSFRVGCLLLLCCCASQNALHGEGLPSQGEPVSVHPLAATIQFAEERQHYIKENIRSYSCRLVKRERIGGRLQAYQYADIKVRCAGYTAGQKSEPMSVLMKFLGPTRLKGRLVLFTEGDEDGQAWVRMGGPGLFKNVELKVEPNGESARRESRYPITDIGFDRIMQRLIDLAKKDLHTDPAAHNTVVRYFQNAKLKDRSCTHIQVEHPEKSEKFTFYKASLYVDDELNVPVRLVVFDWPPGDGGPPCLMEEYNYMNLKLNVAISHELFAKSRYFNQK